MLNGRRKQEKKTLLSKKKKRKGFKEINFFDYMQQQQQQQKKKTVQRGEPADRREVSNHGKRHGFSMQSPAIAHSLLSVSLWLLHVPLLLLHGRLLETNPVNLEKEVLKI
ncbi:hypothetical protein V6N13_139624 [Hibiscus sabdariffa]|uniref:Uncharacterized protein n=1 Tax=Hibiscus sabdariffa TaxID=183260 RepID=A0ABR2C7M7_9ROSI